MGTIEVGGGLLRYEQTRRAAAQGPPVVLIHGWCGDRSHWAAQQPVLGQSRLVVALDLPWHGESTQTGEISVAAFAGAVAEFVEKRIGGPVVAIGHSMGGMVAAVLAARRPDLVYGVAALDSAHAARPEVLSGLRDVLAGLDSSEADSAIRGLAETLYLPSDAPTERARITEQMVTAPPAVLREGLASMLEFMSGPGDELLASLSMPVAVVTASTGLSDPGRLAGINPSAYLAQALGCGHYLQVFAAAQVNAILDHFLGQLSA
jgi:pimeloyl-ACP methyl ester carboxylesterase